MTEKMFTGTLNYNQNKNKTPVKFQKNQYKTVKGDAHTRYPLSIYFDSKNARKWLSSISGKSYKNNLRIISKPHAYLQTMYKTPVKFQKNQYKTVGGDADAHTRYPLSIYFDSKNARKMAKFNLRKK